MNQQTALFDETPAPEPAPGEPLDTEALDEVRRWWKKPRVSPHVPQSVCSCPCGGQLKVWLRLGTGKLDAWGWCQKERCGAERFGWRPLAELSAETEQRARRWVIRWTMQQESYPRSLTTP